MDEAYEHRQTAQVLVLVLAVAGVAVAMAGLMTGLYALIAVAVVLIVGATAFSTVTTRVDASGVVRVFTFGFPARRVALADVAAVETSRHAVTIQTRSNRKLALGTDDPQGLSEAIARFRSGG